MYSRLFSLICCCDVICIVWNQAREVPGEIPRLLPKSYYNNSHALTTLYSWASLARSVQSVHAMAGVAGYGAGHGPQKRDDRPWSSYISSPIKGLKNLLPSLAPGGRRKEMPHDHEHDIQAQPKATGTQREIDEDWESVQAPKVNI